LQVLKGSLRSIGGSQAARSKLGAFFETDFVLQAGDMLYLTSDGLIDQPNANRMKFGSKQLRQVLADISRLSLSEQQMALEKALDHHQGKEDQRDDITLLGIKCG